MLHEIFEKLKKEYVEPFDSQRDNLGIKHPEIVTQKDLVKKVSEADLSEGYISIAFNAIRDNDWSDKNRGYCLRVYQFLQKHWEIIDDVFHLKDQSLQEEPSREPQIFSYEKYPQQRIQQALLECDDDIKVIDTSTFALLPAHGRSNGDTLINWPKISGKKIRLLVLDPSGQGIKLRSKTNLWRSTAHFKQNILDGLHRLLEVINEHNGLLEVRLMDEIPGAHAIIMSDFLFYGQHWSFQLSQDGSFMEVRGRKNYIYEDYNRHFDSIWSDDNRSKLLDADLYKTIERKIIQSNHQLEFLTGTWRVCLHDRRNVSGPNHEKYAPHFPLGRISQFVLEIQAPADGNPSNAVLTLPDHQKLYNRVLVERLDNKSFAHVRFTDYNRISIHISIRCEHNEEQTLWGHYTMMNHQDMYAGVIMMERSDEESAVFNVPALDLGGDQLPLLRNLAFRDRASFSLEEFRRFVDGGDLSGFSGVYKVYAYARNESGRGIQMNIIKIEPYGLVTYKNLDFKAYGIAIKKGNNLHITLTHSEHDYRTGYCILRTLNVTTKDNPLYTGVFLGISYQKEYPIAKRVAFEFQKNALFEELSPDFFLDNTEKYKMLPAIIRSTFTGRIENFIGFPYSFGNIFNRQDLSKEWEQSVHFGDIFYHSACLHLLTGDAPEALNMLKRAVEHGFYDWSKFEQKASEANLLDEIKSAPMYREILNILAGDYPETEA